jgi:colanic acid/amylovoran biosynthesis glycosyltransferase
VPPSDHRIGYVCKMYPRFSETFIVSEILAREAGGEDIEVISLRPPRDGRFHASLADVRAPVTYLDHDSPKARELWDRLRDLAHEVGSDVVADLLEVPVREACQAIALADLVGERGLTHLHAHFGSVATTVARLAARLAAVTYSFTAHAKDIFHEDVDPDDLRTKLADAHHVVTVSEYNLAYLRDRYGSAARTVHRVYNGLPLGRFPFEDPSGDREVDVVAVGRLVEKKGFEVLVDACAIARDRGRPLRCHIVGTGERETDLADRIRAARLDDQVQLVGALPQDRVRDAVRRAAVMAAPCVVGADGNADGLPTVILEAMALGTPVVSTPVTGIPEAVLDEATGRLVPEHDATALADALLALRDDHAERARLATAARAHVDREFASARQATALRELLPPLAVPVGAEVA